MRNLAQYPITPDEIRDYLQELENEVSFEKTGLYGDMRPLLLSAAKVSIRVNQTYEHQRNRIFELEEQNKELREKLKTAMWCN